MSKPPARPKAPRSRPKISTRNGAQRAVVTFTVDRELLSQFDAAAKREQRSRSNQIVLLMRRLVEGAQP